MSIDIKHPPGQRCRAVQSAQFAAGHIVKEIGNRQCRCRCRYEAIAGLNDGVVASAIDRYERIHVIDLRRAKIIENTDDPITATADMLQLRCARQ